MTDDIVEAALPALMDYAEAYDMFPDVDPDPRHAVEKIINAVRPMIEAQERERLAKEVDWAVEQAIKRGAVQTAIAHEETADWLRSHGGE